MDLAKFKDLKKDIISLKKSLNILIKEQDEVEGDGGLFSGDFNSEASKQSWSEFWNVYATWGGGLTGTIAAVSTELSSWHGSRDTVYVKDPYLFPQMQKASIPISSSWETKYISSNMKASDLISDPNIKRDENGEYFEKKLKNQTLKLYLPNSDFFSAWADLGICYQFTTDNGTKYQLVLELNSDKSLNELLAGVQDQHSTLATSMRNLEPAEGNGWQFKYDPDSIYSAYWKVSGNSLRAYTGGRILEKDLKSSWALWWDKWGVTAQIVAGIVVSFFAPAFGGWLAARATAFWGAESAIVTFLTSQATIAGVSFNATGSILVAEFLLEAAVNVPAAVIDLIQENPYGAAMGIMFCAFPLLIRAGKIGRFIDPYNDIVAREMAQKIALGVREGMPAESMLKFIESLSPKEKLIFAKGLAFLEKEGVPEAVRKGIKETMEEAVKKGTFPGAFERWIKTGGFTMGKTLGAGLLYWGASSLIYAGVQKLMAKEGDTRDIEQVKQDAAQNAEKLANDNKDIDEDRNLGPSSTTEILTSITDGQSETNGARIYYSLSKEGQPLNSVAEYVAQRKMIEAKESVRKAKEDREFYDKQKFPTTYYNLKNLNRKAGSELSEKEINELVINPEYMDATDLEVLLSDSQNQMSEEIAQVEKEFDCLKQNFDPVEGDWFFEEGDLSWFIKFKCITPIKLPTWAGHDLNVKANESIYIYKPKNGSYSFQYSANKDNMLYNGFRCKA